MLPITMKCRYYQKAPNRFLLYLSWRGKKYWRSHYDYRLKLVSEVLARRLADAVNADIDEKGAGFNPLQWFETKGFAFRQYAETWLADHQMGYAPSVRRDVGRMVAAAQAFFGDQDLRSIRHGNIEDYLRQLPGHLSPKTRQNYLVTLHKIFADAYRREEIPRIPGFPRVSVPEPETKWLDRETQDRIIAAIPEHDRPIFQFIRTYGVRPGEARALQWDCVDFERGVITIKRTFSGPTLQETTKTGRVRHLPLVEPIASILRQMRALGGLVFRNRSGRPYLADISKIWNEARDKVGAPAVNLYQGTRHSLGVQKLSEGHSLDILRDIFGHTTTKTTRRYAEANMDGKRRVIE